MGFIISKVKIIISCISYIFNLVYGEFIFSFLFFLRVLIYNMPPRGKKVDPAQLEKQFSDYCETEEHALWKLLKESRGRFEMNLTATSPDITIDLSGFLIDLQRLSTVMKIPRKSQGYEQIYLKTAFFPQVGLECKISVDGLNFELQKSCVDIARDCREDFIRVLSGLDLVSELEASTFTSQKKDLIKKLTSFEKSYMAHYKKAHDYLLNSVLAVILKPLSDALEANINLYYLENRNHEKKKWFKDPAPEFRIKACKEKFADSMRELVVRLRDNGSPLHLTDIMKSLIRIQIDTSTHDALKFFVSPVKKAWRELRSVMKATYKRGFVMYKQPLKDNVELVDSLKKLLDLDLRAELLLGDSLKKDQLEFIYDVLNHIRISPLSDQLKSDAKEPDILRLEIIPQLAAFKALQQMYQVTEDIANKQKELREAGLELEPIKADKNVIWSQDKEPRYEGIRRMWVWENYIADFDKPAWIECSQDLSKINIMVQEDISDFIIARHLKIKSAPGEPEMRPPYLWNHYLMHNRYVKKEEPLFKEEETPPEVKPPRKFRHHVNPEQYYIDGRISVLIEKVEKLAIGLRSHQSEIWNNLIRSVINALNQEKPDSGEEDISFDEEKKEEEETKEPQRLED